MNPHFQPYTDLSTPNTPSPDGNYTNLGAGGAVVGATGNGTVANVGNNSSSVGGNGAANGNSMVHHQNGHPQQMPMDGGGQTNFHHLNNNNNSSVKQCAGCGGKIVERFFLHALDRYWHNACLKCYCCGAMLADIGSSCYTRSGMILCKTDYSRMFGTTACSACGLTIAANEFVMRTTSPISNQQQNQQQQQQQQTTLPTSILDDSQKHFPNQLVEHHVFHLKCFTCSKCASQLRPGDRYYMIAGSLVCEQDWHKLLKSATPNPPVRKGKVGRPRRSRD